MPGPQTVVTFTDADGDEFPIALVGDYREADEAHVIDEARRTLGNLEALKRLRPTHPVAPKGVAHYG